MHGQYISMFAHEFAHVEISLATNLQEFEWSYKQQKCKNILKK
jgi:hypothetical protein